MWSCPENAWNCPRFIFKKCLIYNFFSAYKLNIFNKIKKFTIKLLKSKVDNDIVTQCAIGERLKPFANSIYF